jgi:hypothetical protein
MYNSYRESIHKSIDKLVADIESQYDVPDQYIQEPIKPETITFAKQLGNKIATELYLLPVQSGVHVSSDGEGEISFEIWKDKKTLTFYTNETGESTWLYAWGDDPNEQMIEGRVNDNLIIERLIKLTLNENYAPPEGHILSCTTTLAAELEFFIFLCGDGNQPPGALSISSIYQHNEFPGKLIWTASTPMFTTTNNSLDLALEELYDKHKQYYAKSKK